MKETVLVVDDERSILESLSAIFSSEYTVITASSAVEALKILETRPVHVIIADYKMPGEDGLSLLISLRNRYPRVIRVLMTGFADMDLIVRALNEGQIHKFISKPFKVYELRSILEDCMKLAGIAAGKETSSPRGKTVLIAHDSQTTLTMLRLILSARYRILSTANGLEVLNLISGNRVDALVLGVGLEMMDGCTITTYLKKEKKAKFPIVIWSRELSEPFKRYLGECGADHWIDDTTENASQQLLDRLSESLD